MRRKTRGRWSLAALVLAIGGCGDQLYIGSDTVLGIAVGYNTAREAARVDIGYDRHFVTRIPQSVQEKGAPPESGKEAMSVVGCTHLKIGQLSLQNFSETLATGLAAQTFATALQSNPYFKCFNEEQPGGQG